MDMKNLNRTFSLLCFLCAACLLVSCGRVQAQGTNTQPEDTLFSCCDTRTQDFLRDGNAVLLQYRHLGEAEETYRCEDSAAIASFLDAISGITVTGETSLVSSDDSDLFLFTDANGETYSFSFNSHHFQVDKTQYELSDDAALWEMADTLRTHF